MSIFNRLHRGLSAVFLTVSLHGGASADQPSEDINAYSDAVPQSTHDVCLRGAEPYIVINMEDGRILKAHRERELIQTASMAKPMTHIIAFEALQAGHIHPYQRVRISDNSIYAATRWGGNKCAIKNNSTVYDALTFQQAMAASAVRSCNDVTVALSKDVVRDAFPHGNDIPNARREALYVAEMNKRARDLGMMDTYFTNVSGLPDPDNHTTLYDLAKQFRHIYDAQPQLKALLSMEETNIPGWNVGNTLTIMRSEAAEERTFWGKTGTVNQERGGAGWFVVSEKEDGGPHIGIGTVCHPRADAQHYRIREQFTLALLKEAEALLTGPAHKLPAPYYVDWQTP